ncbi:MAG: M12 family metallo-peptidase [Phycisphaerales bacterium]
MRFSGWKRVAALAVVAGCCVGLCTQTARAQNQQGAPVAEDFRDARIVGDAGTMNLNGVVAGDIVMLDLPADIPQDWSIDIPSTAWKNTEISLSLNSIRSDNFAMHQQLANGMEVPMVAPAVRTYMGSIRGVNGSDARGSLLQNGLIASIWQPDGSRLVVQPLSDFIPGAQRGLHVVYRGEDTSCIGVCGNTPEQSAHQLPNGFGERGSCAGGICIAELAIDMDSTYLATYGGTVGAQDRAEAVINVMNHQYTTELNIAHRLTFVLARTGAEPYVNNVIGDLLNALRTDWNANRPGVTRDTTHLFTSRPTGGTIGLAYVGVICDTNGFAYGVSQVSWSGTFGCQTDLVAHEIGHNWSANHCTCTSSTMNPFITCANTFNGPGSGSIAEIDTHRDSRACLTNGGVPPANNNCENAFVVTDYVTTGTTLNATTDGGATGCTTLSGGAGGGENDVWYRFTAPATGNVTVSTCGSAFDTMLSIHSACPGTPENQIACNDDSCGTQSSVTFAASYGGTYLIRVAGYAGATGAFTLNVSGPGSIPFGSDACGSATAVSAGSYFSSVFGTTNDAAGACGSTGTARDIWYSYTAPCAQTINVDTCTTHDWAGGTDNGMDTVLSLYTGCGGTLIQCNDDNGAIPGCTQAGNIRDSFVTATLNAGQTVLIRVSPFFNNFNNGGLFRMNVVASSCGDTCATAQRIVEDGSYFATTTAANNQEGSSTCEFNPAGDVYWLFTSPTTGTANINTCGSNFDTVLSIHSECPATTANQITCNDQAFNVCGSGFSNQSAVSFTAVQGETYIIRVVGWAGQTGNVQLNIDAPARASADNCATGTPLLGGTPQIGSLYDNTPSAAGDSCGGLSSQRDAWYRFISPNSGLLTVTTCGSRNFSSDGVPGVDTVLSLWNGCGGGQITCNDQAGGNCSDSSIFDSTVTTPYSAGTPIWIRVSNYGFGDTTQWYGNGMFRIRATVGAECNDIDFNNDGSLFDPQDIDAFLSVYSEGPCIPASAFCDDIDFNNDTSVFDPCDISSFLQVFSEGPCELCPL